MLTQRESITQIRAATARVDHTLLMIPGPTAITAEVPAAGAQQVLSHFDPRMRNFVAESLATLRNLFPYMRIRSPEFPRHCIPAPGGCRATARTAVHVAQARRVPPGQLLRGQ